MWGEDRLFLGSQSSVKRYYMVVADRLVMETERAAVHKSKQGPRTCVFVCMHAPLCMHVLVSEWVYCVLRG